MADKQQEQRSHADQLHPLATAVERFSTVLEQCMCTHADGALCSAQPCATACTQLMRTAALFAREVCKRLMVNDAQGCALVTAACLPVWELLNQQLQQQQMSAAALSSRIGWHWQYTLSRMSLLFMYPKAHDRRCLYQQESCSGADVTAGAASSLALTTARALPLYVPLSMYTEDLSTYDARRAASIAGDASYSSDGDDMNAMTAYRNALQLVRNPVLLEQQLATNCAAAAAQTMMRALQSLITHVLPTCVLALLTRTATSAVAAAAAAAMTALTVETLPAREHLLVIVKASGNVNNNNNNNKSNATTSWHTFASMLWRYMVFAERYCVDELRRFVAFLTTSAWSQTYVTVLASTSFDDGGAVALPAATLSASPPCNTSNVSYSDLLTPLTDAFVACRSVSPRAASLMVDNAPLIDAPVHVRSLRGTVAVCDMMTSDHDNGVLAIFRAPHVICSANADTASSSSSSDVDKGNDAMAKTPQASAAVMMRNAENLHASLARVCEELSWDSASGTCRDADQLTLLLRRMLAAPLARSCDKDGADGARMQNMFDAHAVLFSRKRARETAVLVPRSNTLASFAAHMRSDTAVSNDVDRGGGGSADHATTLERLCKRWATR